MDNKAIDRGIEEAKKHCHIGWSTNDPIGATDLIKVLESMKEPEPKWTKEQKGAGFVFGRGRLFCELGKKEKDVGIRGTYAKWKNAPIYSDNKNEFAIEMWKAISKYCEENEKTQDNI